MCYTTHSHEGKISLSISRERNKGAERAMFKPWKSAGLPLKRSRFSRSQAGRIGGEGGKARRKGVFPVGSKPQSRNWVTPNDRVEKTAPTSLLHACVCVCRVRWSQPRGGVECGERIKRKLRSETYPVPKRPNAAASLLRRTWRCGAGVRLCVKSKCCAFDFASFTVGPGSTGREMLSFTTAPLPANGLFVRLHRR